MVRPRAHCIRSNKTVWDNLKRGKTVAHLRIHPVRSSKVAWDSLEGGGNVVSPRAHCIRSNRTAWDGLKGRENCGPSQDTLYPEQQDCLE